MRQVLEARINILKYMYKDCMIKVITNGGGTEEIQMEVGLHQGTSLLFIIIIEALGEETPWAVLCCR